MQRARGLIALLEAARQCSWAGLTAASFPPCQALGTYSPGVLAAPASLRSLWSAAGGPPAPPIDHWRRLHSAAATAAAAAACGGGGSAAAAGSGAAAAAAAVTSAAEQKQVLYRGKGMRLFRVLVRLKVFQLGGIAALAVPINTFLATGEVAGTQAVMAAALVVGASVASGALWYYSRRYLGELALLPPAAPGQPPRLRLSVLDFWGNREDNDVALQSLVPPLAQLPEAARRAALRDPLLPLDVEGDRQYCLSPRYGALVDAPTLVALLAGRLPGQALHADGPGARAGNDGS